MALDEFEGGGILEGINQGIRGAVQGFYDAEERNMRKIEHEAKLKAEKKNQARQTMLDQVSLHQAGLMQDEAGMLKERPLTLREALSRMQTAAQDFGKGGERKKSGVSLGFEDVDDKVLSASGGLIGMMYGGQTMPENNMDVKYKEFSGMVGGRGDGMEDNVYMPIVEGESGQQVATLAVSPKEYVVDANTMSLLGNGNPDEGAEIMDKTVKDIRKKATGQTKQQKEIDGLAALNRMRRSV